MQLFLKNAVRILKNELLKLRGQFKFIRACHSMLEQKQRVLAVQAAAAKDLLREKRLQVSDAVNAAYSELENAILDAGLERVQQARGLLFPFALAGTTTQTDAAHIAWKEAKVALCALFDAENKMHEINFKLNKTRKNAAALQHLIIPDLEAKIAYINAQLDERERDEAVRVRFFAAASDMV